MHEIELKPSRWLGLLLAGMTGLAWAGLWLAALPLWIKLGLGAGVVALALRGWRGVGQSMKLRLRADGRVQLRGAKGDWDDIEVRGDSYVSTPLVVLRYRTANMQTNSLVLLPDSAKAEDLRRLRVSLRWASRTRSDTAFPGAG